MVSSPYKFITLVFILFVTTLFSMPNKGGVENPCFNPMTQEGMKNLVKLYEHDKHKLSEIIKDRLILGSETDINMKNLKLSESLWPLDITIPKNKLWLSRYYIRRVEYYIETLNTLIPGIENFSTYLIANEKKKYFKSFSNKVSELKKRRKHFKNISDKAKKLSLMPIPEHRIHEVEHNINYLKNQIDEVNKNKLPCLITVVTLLIKSHSVTDNETAL